MMPGLLITVAALLGQTEGDRPPRFLSPTDDPPRVRLLPPVGSHTIAAEPIPPPLPNEPEPPKNIENSGPSQTTPSRLNFSGWIDGSFTASSARSSNRPMGWNDEANEFLFQQIFFRLEKSLNTDDHAPSFGWRSDWLYGSDYFYTRTQRPIFYNSNRPDHYGWDPVEFFAQAYLPLAAGLDLKVGRFFAPFNKDTVEAISTPSVSRTYTFINSPYTATGGLATLNLNKQWSVAAGAVLGNDLFISEGNEGRFLGYLVYQSSDQVDSWKIGMMLGRGSYNQALAIDNENIVDLLWDHRINNNWTYSFEALYGYENGVARPGKLNYLGQPTIGTGQILGITNYLFYQISEKVTAMGRIELFDDFQGFRTQYEGLYVVPAVGLTFRPAKNMLIRPELRYDYNGESRPFEGQHHLFTASIDVILRW